MDGKRISYHESVRRAYERIKKDGMSNVWDRYVAQGITHHNSYARHPAIYKVQHRGLTGNMEGKIISWINILRKMPLFCALM